MSEAEPIPPTSSVIALRIPMIKKGPVSAPKTSLAANARRNNEKALNILLSAIPDRHLLSFHDAEDAKTLWSAIKARFGRAFQGTKGGIDVRRIEEEVDPDFLSDAHSRTGPAESVTLVKARYKAEKVCHEEMVKMPLVDLKVLECVSSQKCFLKDLIGLPLGVKSRVRTRVSTRGINWEGPGHLAPTEMKKSCWTSYKSYKVKVLIDLIIRYEEAQVYMKSKKEYESHLKINLELLKKEKCHVKPNKVEAKIWILMVGDVRTLIMKEVPATKYSVRPGVKEAVARHGVHVSSIPDKDGMYIEAEIRESKMIGLELEQETTKVVVIKERLKKAKDHQES
ncbi:hypothetical protein Tco_0157265 [Tanacetum coccineum]